MQWLRHTRFEPPSIAEQRQDQLRQERMKLLAAQADARWAAKPSALDAPDKQQPAHMLRSRDPDSASSHSPLQPQSTDSPGMSVADSQQMPQDPPEPATSNDAPTLTTRKRMKKEPKDSPWKTLAQGNPGQDWQPQGWSPPPAKRR